MQKVVIYTLKLSSCIYQSCISFYLISQDLKRSADFDTSPSLDVFLPEEEDNPYESVTTAVTQKPSSLDINHRLNSCPRNGRIQHTTAPHTGKYKCPVWT